MLEMINQKNMNFLIEISKKPRNISELAKRGDMTLSVASTLISRWDKSKIVIKTKSDGNRGKEIIITLTDYGKEQVKLLKEIKRNYIKNKKLIITTESLDDSLVQKSDCKIESTEKEVENGTE